MTGKEFLLREKYAGVPTAEYETDCGRVDSGEPLAYVIGWIPFLDCTIYLDSHPLIPRPETEFWVEHALKTFAELSTASGEGLRILDLFAGSGAAGIAALKHLPESTVDFGEIDTAHFPTILKNVRENGIDGKRARIFETDVWSGIDGTYDAIFANPPYISEQLRKRVDDSVLNHEPHSALFSKDGGFELIAKTIADAGVHLTTSGLLYIEHEPEHAERILSVSQHAGLTAENKRDQYGVFRYSVLSSVA